MELSSLCFAAGGRFSVFLFFLSLFFFFFVNRPV
jgi:hypothetical protein